MEKTGQRTRTAGRLLLIVPGAALLVLGLIAGLLLMGVPMPVLFERLPELHAALLVFGFVGTLISLERAVALRAGWAYLAPVLLAAGTIATLTPLPLIAGQAAITVGLAVHAGQYIAIWRRQPMTATAVQGTGAVAAVAAGLAWCGGVPTSRLVPLLAVFVILTIAGERLELARVTNPGVKAERALFTIGLLLAVSALLTLTTPVAVPVMGVLLLALVAWLVRYDVARATIKSSALPRYVAWCLMLGYAWLVVAALGWIIAGGPPTGGLYDATTHAIFLGFVITMIMAHAPLILPAVLGVKIPYHPALYVPVALLQASLVVRVIGGDAWGNLDALRVGGIGSAIAIVLFGLTAVTVSVTASARARARARHGATP